MNTASRNRQVSFKGSRNQKGLTLIELAIAIAIAAALLFGVFVLVKNAQNKRIATSEAQYLSMMSADLKTKFSGQASFSGISAANLIKLGIVPAPLISGTTLVSGFSTSITVAAANLNGVANDAFAFTYSVPANSCADFVSAAEGAFSKVSVAGTTIKNSPSGDDSITVADLASCAAAASSNAAVAVIFTEGR